jgi:AcrR family transcriptional regulator
MQVRSEETRNKILQSSVKLFADKGYDATGVAEICDASAVSKGAFYHHFPSKQSVFIELLRDWLKGLDVELGRAMSRARNVPEGLTAMAGETRGVFSGQDSRIQLFFEFWHQARRDPEIWKEFIAPYRRYQDYFAGIVEKGIAEGSIKRIDSEVAGQTLVALALGVVIQGVVDPGGAAWDRVMRDAVHFLLTGISKQSPEKEHGGR